MKTCINHPDKEALSICHNCGKDYCELCLDEGKEYYFCKKDDCQVILRNESESIISLGKIICPGCESELELSEKESLYRKIHCPECGIVIDCRVSPPEIIEKSNYTLLLNSTNQGDIAIIKSILDNAGIDHYVFGENFLSVNPLLQPVRFFIKEDSIETARILFKDFDFHIFGVTFSQEE